MPIDRVFHKLERMLVQVLTEFAVKGGATVAWLFQFRRGRFAASGTATITGVHSNQEQTPRPHISTCNIAKRAHRSNTQNTTQGLAYTANNGREKHIR